MTLDHYGLEDTCRHPVSQLNATEGRGAISADKQPQVAVFVVADVSKVLALNDLLHDVISINARVVHPSGVVLHRVLLTSGRPVGENRGKWRAGRSLGAGL